MCYRVRKALWQFSNSSPAAFCSTEAFSLLVVNDSAARGELMPDKGDRSMGGCATSWSRAGVAV